jgi:hypothetical protein
LEGEHVHPSSGFHAQFTQGRKNGQQGIMVQQTPQGICFLTMPIIHQQVFKIFQYQHWHHQLSHHVKYDE